MVQAKARARSHARTRSSTKLKPDDDNAIVGSFRRSKSSDALAGLKGLSSLTTGPATGANSAGAAAAPALRTSRPGLASSRSTSRIHGSGLRMTAMTAGHSMAKRRTSKESSKKPVIQLEEDNDDFEDETDFEEADDRQARRAEPEGAGAAAGATAEYKPSMVSIPSTMSLPQISKETVVAVPDGSSAPPAEVLAAAVESTSQTPSNTGPSSVLKSKFIDQQSRTQQRLWLQRQSVNDASGNPAHAKQRREAERVMKEYFNVRQYSNPLLKAIERVRERNPKLEPRKIRMPQSSADLPKQTELSQSLPKKATSLSATTLNAMLEESVGKANGGLHSAGDSGTNLALKDSPSYFLNMIWQQGWKDPRDQDAAAEPDRSIMTQNVDAHAKVTAASTGSHLARQ